MLVDDICANCDMNGCWQTQFVCIVQDTVFPVRKSTFIDIATHRFPIAQSIFCTQAKRPINGSPGLLSHSKSTVFNTGCDILAGLANHSEFEIMDGYRTVTRDMGNDTFVHQIN